jgi:hypothetical protein
MKFREMLWTCGKADVQSEDTENVPGSMCLYGKENNAVMVSALDRSSDIT